MGLRAIADGNVGIIEDTFVLLPVRAKASGMLAGAHWNRDQEI